MSYRLDLINRAGLFRNYAAWHEHENNWAEPGHLCMAQYLSAIVYSIEKLHHLEQECTQQYEEFSPNLKYPSQKIWFRPPSLFDLFSCYSSYLLNLRLAQNSLTRLLSREFKTSLQQSLHGLVNDKKGCKLDASVYKCLRDYWQQSGFKAKQYRDLEQHYGLITRDAWIVQSSDGPKLKVFLPDDPAVQSESKFTYHNEVDALAFAIDTFEQFHRCVNELSQLIGYDTPRAFDYNQCLPEGVNVGVGITVDPSAHVLCARELRHDSAGSEMVQHLKEVDSKKYSFIWGNNHFPVTHSFFREAAYRSDDVTGVLSSDPIKPDVLSG